MGIKKQFKVGDIVYDYSPQNKGRGVVIKLTKNGVWMTVKYANDEKLEYNTMSEDVVALKIEKHGQLSAGLEELDITKETGAWS